MAKILGGAEIRRVVEEDFGEEIRETVEPRFDFVRQLSAPYAPEMDAAANLASPRGHEKNRSLRIVHSYVAVFGDPLLIPKLNPYPDGLPERLSASGINGVWMRLGIAELHIAVEKTPSGRSDLAQRDLRYARAAVIHFQSVANQARFVLARDALSDPSTSRSTEDRNRLRNEISLRLESEIELARQLFALTQEDSRIGFEPTCQCFYLPLDLVEKVINCRWLLAHFAE